MANESEPRFLATLSLDERAKPERADAARNRHVLLQAAGRILRGSGISALTMESVAAEAGVGIGTVYRRFGDRAGLAYALIDSQEQEFQARFLSGPPPLGPGAPPAERLCAFLCAYVDRFPSHAELIATAEQSSTRRRSGAYGLNRQHLAMLIREINPDLDAHYLADAILAVLSADLYLHQSGVEDMPDGRIKNGLQQLVCGIIGPSQ